MILLYSFLGQLTWKSGTYNYRRHKHYRTSFYTREMLFINSFIIIQDFHHHLNDTNLLKTGPIYNILPKKNIYLAYHILCMHPIIVSFLVNPYFKNLIFLDLLKRRPFWKNKKTCPYCENVAFYNDAKIKRLRCSNSTNI